MMNDELLNKIKSSFLGLAIGDALGVPVEFKLREFLKENPVNDMLEYMCWNQPKGTWSDDSSMTFCLAESLCNGYNIEDIGQKFVKWKNEGYWGAHNEVFDIGGTTRYSLDRICKGESAKFSGNLFEEDNGNGSLMRNIPMPFFLLKEQDINLVYETVKSVSAITHAHFRSVFSCFIHTIFVIELIKGKGKFKAYLMMQNQVKSYIKDKSFNGEEISLFCRILNENIFDLKENDIKSTGYVLDTLEASFWCFLTTDSYNECVLKAVNLGGDTDTTACVAGGISGLYYGEDKINLNWIFNLVRKKDIEELANKYYKSLK